MPAYVRLSLGDFIDADPLALIGHLESNYAKDQYVTQFVQQTRAWGEIVQLLQTNLREVLERASKSDKWTVLLEFPLYRLRKRIDLVILMGASIVVIEAKVGEDAFTSTDLRQIEEYALDLRDFHAASHQRRIIPVLWCTDASNNGETPCASVGAVTSVHRAGRTGLAAILVTAAATAPEGPPIDGREWDHAAYRPVPNVIEAATSIFAGHDVRSIAQADATNLKDTAARAIQLVVQAREHSQHLLMFVTGVPGSGKTLAGLHVVHDAVATGAERRGDIVYLSGNTPLVSVLREALARDEHTRNKVTGKPATLADIRRDVRTRIQHINDFLKHSLSTSSEPPHEHAIVFDEAQRAWDTQQGQKKFGRETSEPSLLLELMSRHRDWCACICLVGGGQEINAGEQGIAGWGDALRKIDDSISRRWLVHAPPDVLRGGTSTAGGTLGDLPASISVQEEPVLQLHVPMRSFRSPHVSKWVGHVLDGERDAAAALASSLGDFPIILARSLSEARAWLKGQGRGHRRYGLVASSGARRLRADGLGVALTAMDGAQIAHWYLNPSGDIRSSCSLEVTANEYTCQGLEIDFAGVCWDGDLIRDARKNQWVFRRLNGSKWQAIRHPSEKTFKRNSYRVLLTRGREGMVIWIPQGDPNDSTRDPRLLDATADFLLECGAHKLAVD